MKELPYPDLCEAFDQAGAGLRCFVSSWCGTQEDGVAFSNFPELKMWG